MMPIVHPLRFVIVALLLFGAGSPGRALQLGETKAQLLARHGAPGAEDRARSLAMYFWDGWSAQVEFEGDVIRRLIYRRNWYLGDHEVTSLLQSNGGTTRWREVTVAGARTRQWVRDDGALATCLVDRALSMTFLARRPPVVAAQSAAPKVVVPAIPPILSSTPPTFPKLLGSMPESEPVLPKLALKPAMHPLPRLPVVVTQPTIRPPEGRDSLVLASLRPGEDAAPAPVRQALASTLFVGGAGMNQFGMLATLGIAVGAVVFFTRFYVHRKTASVAPHTAVPGELASAVRHGVVPAFEKLRLDQFELLVGEVFRRQGFSVELSAAMGQDDGIDLMLRRDSETILVQCKDWRATRVAEREVCEFYGAMAATGAPRGIFVTTGSFTREAQDFAVGKGIELMDGAVLEARVSAVVRPGEDLLALPGWIEEFAAQARIFDPECPVCQGAMVIRSNRTTGAQSWTCHGYPRCPGKREPRLDLLAVGAGH